MREVSSLIEILENYGMLKIELMRNTQKLKKSGWETIQK